MRLPIYMDNHATTRVDPRVVESMLPYFVEDFGNPGSVSHSFGSRAKEAVDAARLVIARAIDADEREIVFTSGATESNNLALRGITERTRRKGNHLVSVTTEHKAILDPLEKLGRRGFEITLLKPVQNGDPLAGRVFPDQVAEAIRPDTALVSVMLANNEMGVIQPLEAIAAVCRAKGVLLHTDATQAVGKVPVDVRKLDVNLMSFSAHKLYGPKGIGALYVRRADPMVRLESQIDGGGQERGRRSGTLNVPGIVGFARAMELCLAELPKESVRLARMRDRLYTGLMAELPDLSLNGPALGDPTLRLPGNLNVSFGYVDGEALMMNMRDVAVSSGSACTSANPEPSHVLRALGVSEDRTRSSLRFGLGRFNTDEEVEFAIHAVVSTVRRLEQLGSFGTK
jgi:cysteine desulfurase